jgi:hypothetical protein
MTLAVGTEKRFNFAWHLFPPPTSTLNLEIPANQCSQSADNAYDLLEATDDPDDIRQISKQNMAWQLPKDFRGNIRNSGHFDCFCGITRPWAMFDSSSILVSPLFLDIDNGSYSDAAGCIWQIPTRI